MPANCLLLNIGIVPNKTYPYLYSKLKIPFAKLIDTYKKTIAENKQMVAKFKQLLFIFYTIWQTYWPFPGLVQAIVYGSLSLIQIINQFRIITAILVV